MSDERRMGLRLGPCAHCVAHHAGTCRPPAGRPMALLLRRVQFTALSHNRTIEWRHLIEWLAMKVVGYAGKKQRHAPLRAAKAGGRSGAGV